MASKYSALRTMSDEELITEYDATAPVTQLGLNFIREELARREQDRQTRQLVTLTVVMTVLTAVVTLATIVNVWVALKR